MTGVSAVAALGDIALDSSVQTVTTELQSGEILQAIEALRIAVQALTRSVGQVTPDTAGRMRVLIDSISAGLTLATITSVGTVTTLTNQSQLGGYSATEQIPALTHMSADNLRRNITVS